jgi:hypothetical protein
MYFQLHGSGLLTICVCLVRLEMILAMEEFVLQPANYSRFGSSLSFFLHALYDEDLISEEALANYATNMQKLRSAMDGGEMIAQEEDEKRWSMFIHPLMTQFLNSVQEDSEDGEEDDEEEN